ncbi:MAG TPA: hypothetical protein VGB59_06955 [Allosphingosinicella sp.]|jgi:hypothetical protein
MSTHHDFYRARAIEARTDAEAAVLDNVRDRCLRAAEAWEAMAARAARTETLRSRQESAKAEAAATAAAAAVPTI